MKKTRNYKAEYRRRLVSAAKRGLTRSQARGHARHGEAPVKPKKPSVSDSRLETAFKLLRKTGKQSVAAKQAGVSAERFRRFLRENTLAERAGKSWRITDSRLPQMMVLSDGKAYRRILRDQDQASLNGRYLNAVKSFLRSNDIAFLQAFKGQSVIDAKGKSHLLETDPNALHRIASAGDAVFHEIYRLVS